MSTFKVLFLGFFLQEVFLQNHFCFCRTGNGLNLEEEITYCGGRVGVKLAPSPASAHSRWPGWERQCWCRCIGCKPSGWSD